MWHYDKHDIEEQGGNGARSQNLFTVMSFYFDSQLVSSRVWKSLSLLPQAFAHTSVSCARKPSRSDVLWSLTWGRSMVFINSMPTVRDVPKSLCVRIVVTPQAALMSTSSMWGSVIPEALPFAGIIVARPTRTIDLHLRRVSSTHIYFTQPLHTTYRTHSTGFDILEMIFGISTANLLSSFLICSSQHVL